MSLHNTFALVAAHPLVFGLGAYYGFSAYVDSMDAPTDKSSRAYRKLYRVLHYLAANIKRAVAAKLPFVADQAPDPNAQSASDPQKD